MPKIKDKSCANINVEEYKKALIQRFGNLGQVSMLIEKSHDYVPRIFRESTRGGRSGKRLPYYFLNEVKRRHGFDYEPYLIQRTKKTKEPSLDPDQVSLSELQANTNVIDILNTNDTDSTSKSREETIKESLNEIINALARIKEAI